MQYGSVQMLYTFINWSVLLVSTMGGISCVKEGIEAKLYGTPLRDVLIKIRKKIIACIIGVIGSTFVGFVKGYF